jgi:predicted homoserine dehydrogenase-like protein
LPLGLAHDVKVVRPVKQGQSLAWDDVQMPGSRALEMRKEMEKVFAG